MVRFLILTVCIPYMYGILRHSLRLINRSVQTSRRLRESAVRHSLTVMYCSNIMFHSSLVFIKLSEISNDKTLKSSTSKKKQKLDTSSNISHDQNHFCPFTYFSLFVSELKERLTCIINLARKHKHGISMLILL